MSTLTMLLIGFLLSAGNHRTSEQKVEVYVFLAPEDYIQPHYATVDVSQAPYLFLEGEPILMKVQLKNSSPLEVVLATRSADIDGLVSLALYRSVADGWREVDRSYEAEERASVTVFSDEQTLSMGNQIRLPAGALLSITGRVRFAELPGLYELRLSSVTASCEPDCRLIRQSSAFRFAVRSSQAHLDRVEIVARQARRAIASGETQEAQDRVAELLALHPNSVAGYQLSAEVSEKNEKWGKAEAEYRRALALLRGGQDPQLIDARDPTLVQRRALFLERRLRHAVSKRR